MAIKKITLGLDKTVLALGYTDYKALFLDWAQASEYPTRVDFALHHGIDLITANNLINNAEILYG